MTNTYINCTYFRQCTAAVTMSVVPAWLYCPRLLVTSAVCLYKFPPWTVLYWWRCTMLTMNQPKKKFTRRLTFWPLKNNYFFCRSCLFLVDFFIIVRSLSFLFVIQVIVLFVIICNFFHCLSLFVFLYLFCHIKSFFGIICHFFTFLSIFVILGHTFSFLVIFKILPLLGCYFPGP